MSRAIKERKARDWYERFSMHAGVQGRKVLLSFEEMFPAYDTHIDVPIDPETVSIMDKLAAENFAKLEREHGSKRTSDTN